MKVELENGDLRGKGIFSFFRSGKFTLHLETGHNRYKVNLKVRRGYVGYIFELVTGSLQCSVVVKGRPVEVFVANVESGGRIAFQNKMFEGHISLRVFRHSVFAELESDMLRKRGVGGVACFSNKVRETADVVIRELYSGVLYAVDVHEDSVKLASGESVSRELPYGWEEGRTREGRRFYIDHGHRITQWLNPVAEMQRFGGTLGRVAELFADNGLFSPFRGSTVLNVQRERVIQSSYRRLVDSLHTLKHTEVKIKFEDEIGGDGGGLLREYFDLVSAEFSVDPHLEAEQGVYDLRRPGGADAKHPPGAQASPQDDRGAGECGVPAHEFFLYLGAILGLVIRYSASLDITFSLCFYENLLGRAYTLPKVQDVVFQSSLLKILRNEEDFSEALGEDLDTEESRVMYVDSILRERYFLCGKERYELIRAGFYSVAPEGIASVCTSYVLSTLVTSHRGISVSMLRPHVVYVNCSAETGEIKFLWRILGNCETQRIRKFLRFCTGLSSVPMGLLLNNEFKLTIEKQNQRDMLFRSSTCTSRLWIGVYDSLETMERIFETCINETEGFHVV